MEQVTKQRKFNTKCWTNIEATVERMIKVIDARIDRAYKFDEPSIKEITICYIKKYLAQSNNGYPRSQLKILCTTAYLLALKYHLDSAPKLIDYSKIVNVSCKFIKAKELEIGYKFLFNFTPMNINLETNELSKV